MSMFVNLISCKRLQEVRLKRDCIFVLIVQTRIKHTIRCLCRHVAGFVSKNVAHEMLRGCNSGTFLLRFSEGEVGGVSVAYVSPTDGGKWILRCSESCFRKNKQSSSHKSE